MEKLLVFIRPMLVLVMTYLTIRIYWGYFHTPGYVDYLVFLPVLYGLVFWVLLANVSRKETIIEDVITLFAMNVFHFLFDALKVKVKRKTTWVESLIVVNLFILLTISRHRLGLMFENFFVDQLVQGGFIAVVMSVIVIKNKNLSYTMSSENEQMQQNESVKNEGERPSPRSGW